MELYKITCLKCKKSDDAMIYKDGRIDFAGGAKTNFLSARFRGDANWGFECVCGNDTRLAKEELGDFEKLAYGTPMGLDILKDKLVKRKRETFTMVRA